jgi:oxygen-independent coproporphyrinogen-3 oxidase
MRLAYVSHKPAWQAHLRPARIHVLETPIQPPWLFPRAAYIHIPFCAHHCGYCDFAVATGQDHLIELYLDALEAELSTLQEPRQIATLYLGGGTPTYPSPGQLEHLFTTLRRWFVLLPGYEFSVEANPRTLSAEKVAVLARHGVNRVSLGAQSFQTRSLAVLERDHQPAEVIRAVELVKRKIGQVSIDLIFAVPDQTLAGWESDLKQALSLNPEHISTYGLTYEKGTRLWKQRERGEIKSLDEETELLLYSRGIDLLEETGFEHYEISNFARPGMRSRHSQVYWANEAYFGFGMGAARYVNGRRELNTRNLREYIRRSLAGESAVFQSEILEPRERARETMAVQLRRKEGIDRAAFFRQTGFELDGLAEEKITNNVSLGLLEDTGASVHLTRRGKYVADAVIHDLMLSKPQRSMSPDSVGEAHV